MRKKYMMFEINFFNSHNANDVYWDIKNSVPMLNDLCISIDARDLTFILPLAKKRNYVGRMEFVKSHDPKTIQQRIKKAIPPHRRLWLSVDHKFLKSYNKGGGK